MKFWYEIPNRECVIIDYGRYEAVTSIPKQGFFGTRRWFWEPVLAGPMELVDVAYYPESADGEAQLELMTDQEYIYSLDSDAELYQYW